MKRTAAPRTRVERSILEVEGYLRDFAEDNPHVVVSLLRFSNVLGTDITTALSRALEMPLVPSILGFDPLLQFTEEDDVIRSIEFVLRNRLPGIFNVADMAIMAGMFAFLIFGIRKPAPVETAVETGV